MATETESVVSVYRDKTLIAIIKRDAVSRKTIVYAVKEASVDQIVGIIDGAEDKKI